MSNQTEIVASKLTHNITQVQIRDYAQHLNTVRDLKGQLKAAEEIVGALEKLYDDWLTKGYTQEPGDLQLVLVINARQAIVKWKEKFAEIAGPRAVEQAQKDAGVTEIRHVAVKVGT